MTQLTSLYASYGGIVNVLPTDVGIGPAYLAGQPVPAPQPFRGIWDTGATNTVICQAIIDALGLKVIDVVMTHHAQGSKMAEVFLVSVLLPGGVSFPSLRVTKGDFGAQGFHLLIGMDIISQGDFCLTNNGGASLLTFNHPASGIEQLHATVKDNAYDATMRRAQAANGVPQTGAVPRNKIGRNEDCPCGSGKKFKHCHPR